MSEDSLKRLTFDDGSWWELCLRPTTSQVRRLDPILQDVAAKDGEQGSRSPDVDGVMPEDRALAVLTNAWSWEEPVTGETVTQRRWDHYVEALRVLNGEILPFLIGLTGALSPRPSSSASSANRKSRRTTPSPS